VYSARVLCPGGGRDASSADPTAPRHEPDARSAGALFRLLRDGSVRTRADLTRITGHARSTTRRRSWSATTRTSWLSASTLRWPDIGDLVFVKDSSEIGAGVISDGTLRPGALGAAGDLGHIAVPHSPA